MSTRFMFNPLSPCTTIQSLNLSRYEAFWRQVGLCKMTEAKLKEQAVAKQAISGSLKNRGTHLTIAGKQHGRAVIRQYTF